MATGKKYSGRLAFDSDSGFHLAEDGKPVLTEDKGKTWRYANEGDPSHIARYQKRTLEIDTTANQFAELAFQHGEEKAAELVEPHHFEVQPGDPHFDGVKADPDSEAATITSHTEAKP